MSYTIMIWPILSVLLSGLNYLDKNSYFVPVNQQQEYFLSNYYSYVNELNKFSDQELKTKISHDHNELNKFLTDNGFSIKLNPFEDPRAFGVVSIANIVLQWLYKGQRISLILNDKKYVAVQMDCNKKLDCNESHIQIIQSGVNKILKIRSKSGDTACIVKADKILKDFELLDYIEKLKSKETSDLTAIYDYAIFPVVELEDHTDISWLCDLKIKPADFFIKQAYQETKFKMDESGAQVENAVAVEFFPECFKEVSTFEIGGPFYLWIEREGLSVPLFAAYIDFESFKEIINNQN